jgi:hypothetical protein
MKFYEHQTTYSSIRRKARQEYGRKFVDLSEEQFYTNSIRSTLGPGGVVGDPMCHNHACAERAWIKSNKPYYKLWPGIAKSLLNLKLDIPVSMVKLPHQALLIKLPEDQDFLGQDGFTCRTIVVAYGSKIKMNPVFPENSISPNYKMIIVLSDWGERDQFDCPVYYVQQLHIADNTTVEDSIPPLVHPTANVGLSLSIENRLNIVRLMAGVCLLGDDSELVKPEVLNRDQSKFMKTGDISLIDKAKKRGKYGFAIGDTSEVLPHYRNPHLCLVWTGEGKKIPRIVVRKGSIVKRKIATTIPSGYDMENNNGIGASVGE